VPKTFLLTDEFPPTQTGIARMMGEIARRYPRDRATGFAAGDLRGFVWTEVKKR